MKQTEKDLLRTEYAKIWGKDPKMVDYCVSNTATIAILPDGGIVDFDKQKIETRFCFGESGYDYNEAVADAQHARTSTSYLYYENMKRFNEMVADAEKALNTTDRFAIILDECYIKQGDCKLRGYRTIPTYEVCDLYGGSVRLADVYGQRIPDNYRYKGHFATREELQLIIDALKQARADHEKKVNAYIKRYGTSKVVSWTYWRDA